MKRFDAQTLAQVLYASTHSGAEEGTDNVESFILFLQKNNLTALLPSILRRYQSLVAADELGQSVRIIVAQDTPQERALAETACKQFGIPVSSPRQFSQDAQLVGGCVIVWNNHRYDLSLQRQITRLQETLVR